MEQNGEYHNPSPSWPVAFAIMSVEDDYGMVQGVYKHTTRGTLVGYFLQLMRIGIGDEEREARVQQIILGNKAELRPYIF
jgi:hypothetical protein